MKKIQNARSLPTYLNEIIYTEAALGATDLTSGELLDSYKQLVADWYDIARKENFSRHEVIRATAKLRVKTQELNLTIREINGLVLVASNQDRESRLYRRFFKTTPSKMSQFSIVKQMNTVDDFVIPAIEELEEGHDLKPYKDRLVNILASTRNVINEIADNKANRTRTSLDVEGWKEKTNTARMTLFGDLLKIAGENGLGRSWAENFFNRRSSRRSEREEEVAEAEETSEVNLLTEASESNSDSVAA